MNQPEFAFDDLESGNAIDEYAARVASLTGRWRSIVLEVIEFGPGTDRDIEARMGCDYRSMVRPRISELLEVGILEELGRLAVAAGGRIVGIPRRFRF